MREALMALGMVWFRRAMPLLSDLLLMTLAVVIGVLRYFGAPRNADVVPSRDALVVRLGWTFKSAHFDSCKLLADVLSALPKWKVGSPP